jgi:hypothetical protein
LNDLNFKNKIILDFIEIKRYSSQINLNILNLQEYSFKNEKKIADKNSLN